MHIPSPTTQMKANLKKKEERERGEEKEKENERKAKFCIWLCTPLILELRR